MNSPTLASLLCLALVTAACTTPHQNNSADAKLASSATQQQDASSSPEASTEEQDGALTSSAEFANLSNDELEVMAKNGNSRAQVALGVRYAKDTKDEAYAAKAFEWFKAAADQGDAAGQYFVGVSYARGAGVMKNESEAVLWYEKSAKQNYSPALYWLGRMIAHGRGGISQSWDGAYSYLRRAADLGNTRAMTLLAQMYVRGDGVEQDYQTAARLYRLVLSKKFSQIAQYNLRALINNGRVQWQPGDPGKPPEPKTDAQSAEQSVTPQP